jgi:hypothetical protein
VARFFSFLYCIDKELGGQEFRHFKKFYISLPVSKSVSLSTNMNMNKDLSLCICMSMDMGMGMGVEMNMEWTKAWT